jgi:16S rRNA A1518/A1519 N6-dimethyltransferase RsmA/KsgA/DIM1 with predicted DNA glycosylase/AP lyase activity
MPVEVVRRAAAAVGLEPGARVLEVGAGTGQLTQALLEVGFDVVALEPGDALRVRAAIRAPGATGRRWSSAG